MISAAHDTVRNHALDIPKHTHAEASQLAHTAFERLLAVIESLEGDDWSQPTECTEWTVRDMVAHLAGGCAGYASWGEFVRQYVRNPYLLSTPVKVDAVNRLQVEDRADHTPEELVAELREVGPKAVRTRHRIPWIVRSIPMPPMPPLGVVPIGYLLDIIYPRDEWMHRADLCRATGRKMLLTPDHDARIVELVLLDMAKNVRDLPAVDLILTGDIEMAYRFGKGEAMATITMDLIEFNRLASERITPDEAPAVINGNAATARVFLENCAVVY
jgi:uncharacterized protein (TIGR03083 family)